MMSPSPPSESSSVQTTATKTDTSRSGGVKVTTKAESTGIVDNLELNPWYFRTVPGILKMVQLVRTTPPSPSLSLTVTGSGAGAD